MKRLLLTGITLAALGSHAHAQNSIDQGDWLLRLGATYVDPSSSGATVSTTVTDPQSMQPVSIDGKLTADSDASLTFNLTYMMTGNLGLELLGALPFQHDIELDGTKVGSARQIPPTLSLQWHQPIGRIVPYVGIGLNWTEFYSERALGSSDLLSLDDSTGLAAQVGFDFIFAERWLLNADARYISMKTEASINGEPVGSIDISPWTVGVSLGFKFN